MMLEPSAGKGDILDGVKAAGHHCAMECAEIDPDLREVLRGKKYLVAAEDFLSWDAQTRYDLIMMNPPFQNGEYHLLHALDLMQHGGQIVCLLNAATLNNAESPARRDLMQRLEKYKAEIQTIPDAFKHAERAADVDVALIYVTIPKQRQDSYNLDDLRRAADLPPCDVESNQLAFRDPIEALVPDGGQNRPKDAGRMRNPWIYAGRRRRKHHQSDRTFCRACKSRERRHGWPEIQFQAELVYSRASVQILAEAFWVATAASIDDPAGAGRVGCKTECSAEL